MKYYRYWHNIGKNYGNTVKFTVISLYVVRILKSQVKLYTNVS